MDTETTKRIIGYYEDLWYQKSGVFKPKLLRLLPYPLQMEICYDLNAVPLYSSLIFRKLPEAFLRRLSLDMSHQFYLPGDVVYSHNQNKTIMVCITSGVLELLSDEDDESPMISFAKGTCFGEISLVYNIPARCTVKAATYVECQVLEKTKFIRLMMTYPDLVDSIRNEIEERINRSRLKKIKQGDHAEFSLNIYASKDRKKSSIKCLKDKLRYIQGISDVDTLTHEDKLDENCLNLYIISEHVKKRMSIFTCVKSKFPWILEADCPLVKYWELYMLSIVFYISITYPYFIGFKRMFPSGIYFYIQIIITLSLILNLFMTSITAVKTKKLHIKDFRSILNYRMNTLGFYLDVVAIIPFEYIVTIHQTVKYYDNYREHLFYLCKGIKLCLIWRLSSFFENLERKLLLNSLLVKITKYCVYICLLCYWSGVILYMESCFVCRCSENSWFSTALVWDSQQRNARISRTKYPLITSVYFATTILLSVGYGDYTPGDIYDMAFVAFLSLYGVLFSGYCISEFSAVVTHWSRTKTAFLEVIITIDKFMKENNMHPAIKSRIMAFYELQWQYNSGVELTDNDNWLEKTVVPSELRKKVLHQARFKALTSIKFFQVKNKAYIHTLTEAARDIILPPGEIVFYGGTVTRELYIIESGYCLVTSNKLRENNTERVIGPGSHVGLLVLLYGVPTLSTVVTLTHCKLVSVSHYAYTSALSLFPAMKEHEDLLTPEELQNIEEQAKTQTTDSYLQHYNRLTMQKRKVKIASLLQEFFNRSWIDGIIIIKGHHLSPPKILLLAYYWTATTFGGAGFGDITPQNIKHMILCICVNIHGVLFFGYVYARIASLKAMADQVVTKFQENLNHLELFLNREKVPFALKKTILEYWKYQWKRTGGWSHQSILGKFHANLNEDAVLYMYEKTLREIPLFENVEYSFFRAFAKKLKELYFQKGYMVMRSNEVIDTMFIIYRGKVDIISNINEVEACMGPGGIFGNIRGATKYMTMSNVIASRNIDLLCIQGRDFYALLKSYPSVLQKVKESVESAAKDYVLPTIIQESSSGPNQVTNFSLSYETGEEEEDEFEIDPELFVESPEKSLAESHGSKSITSGNVDYIPAALLFFKPHRWFRSSVIPDSGLVTFMEYFILFVSYVDFMLLVYQMAFLSVPYFFYVCVIFDILFLLKVFLDIHSGYMNRYGDYVLNPKKVRKVTIAIWASILSHVNACLFFKLSCLTPVHCTSANWMSKEALNLRAKYSEGNFFALYVAALWYIINLLTITGTGDVSAQNSFEVIETTIVCIIIKFCTGLLISEMSAMITAHSSSRIAYDYDINELRDGLRDMDLSVHQMSKMWDYMPALVYKLPFRLRCQVMQAVYGSHIRESVIFSKTDDDFSRMLVMWMKHCVFFPGNYIVQCGDSDQCIYFIHRGQVEVLTVHPNLTESIYDVLGPEDSFGIAQGLFVGVVHHFSFRARTVVDIVYLKLDQWKYLLDYYPKSAKIVKQKVHNVYLAI
ncbi:hypothetical protein HF086_002076 [Spodoptera exigua]|uniref:Cyclic nucleotide-binding domain-containing protein n=1 Tax=Spodoptera exigua TaxID=7107 RepID=A0A922MME4_SPOEX|nr:hypothetical protein HF086_002076 [Spodoptera exigua]